MKKHRTIILITLAIIVLSILSFGAKQKNESFLFPGRAADKLTPPTFQNPMLHAQGTSIVDATGTRIVFKGINAEGWLQWQGLIFGAGFTSETDMMNRLTSLAGKNEAERFRTGIYNNFLTIQDIEKMKQDDFNAIRLPFNHTILEDDANPYVYKQSGWDLLDKAVVWGEQNNLYILLDLHSAPGGQSKLFTADPEKNNLLWKSDENKKRTVALWRAIASRYKDKTIVAGYDILNEPDPPSSADLINLYIQITDAIRSVDPYHLIVYEGTKFSSDFSLFEKRLDYNQAYSFHTYSLLGKDKKKELLTAVADRSKNQNIPYFNSEFGANTASWTKDAVQLLNDQQNSTSGWFFWNWKNTPNKNPGKYTNLWEIHAGDNWQKVATWLSWPYPPSKKPTHEEVRMGIDEILSAVRIDKTTQNNQTLRILMGTK